VSLLVMFARVCALEYDFVWSCCTKWVRRWEKMQNDQNVIKPMAAISLSKHTFFMLFMIMRVW
jgi:hypothetical protein